MVARSGANVNDARLRKQIARCEIPMLAFAAVGSEFYGFAIGTVKRFVDVEHDLNGVVSGRNIFEARARVALRVIADDERIVRPPTVHRDAENHLRFGRIVNLHAWFVARVV